MGRGHLTSIRGSHPSPLAKEGGRSSGGDKVLFTMYSEAVARTFPRKALAVDAVIDKAQGVTRLAECVQSLLGSAETPAIREGHRQSVGGLLGGLGIPRGYRLGATVRLPVVARDSKTGN